MTAFKLQLLWMWPEAKEAFIFSVWWIILCGKLKNSLFVESSEQCHWSGDNMNCGIWIMFDLSLTERHFVFMCSIVSMCSGEMGRGCECSGTGWESPPSPPGGTPSPRTSHLSRSPTTPSGPSATLTLISATWVHPPVITVYSILIDTLSYLPLPFPLCKAKWHECEQLWWFWAWDPCCWLKCG